MFSIQEEVILNQYAQGIKPIGELLEWYNSFDIDKKRSILIEIWSLANQAKVKESLLPWAEELPDICRKPRR